MPPKHCRTGTKYLAMKTNVLKEGVLTQNSVGLGTVTRKMVRARAAELAIINGRSARNVTTSDREQAKRELTGEPDVDPKEAILESAPESERWDLLPGWAGHKVAVPPSEDEDAEGRSDNQRLVEEGVAAAELDQMRRASKANALLNHTKTETQGAPPGQVDRAQAIQ